MKPQHPHENIRENGRPSHEPVSAAATTWPQAPRVEAARRVQPVQPTQPTQPSVPDAHAQRPTDRDELMRRWDRIQAGFVDDPQRAVVEAEQLADQLLAQVRDALERERTGIVSAGHARGASTEDLRMCVKRYRALIDRLVAFV